MTTTKRINPGEYHVTDANGTTWLVERYTGSLGASWEAITDDGEGFAQYIEQPTLAALKTAIERLSAEQVRDQITDWLNNDAFTND